MVEAAASGDGLSLFAEEATLSSGSMGNSDYKLPKSPITQTVANRNYAAHRR